MTREPQMDLTKYFKKKVILNDLGFSKGKNTNDLVSEMQSHGLCVDYLEITGEIVRVPVKANGTKPDTGGQKSGYYVVNQLGDHYFATFGNWRNGFEGKWSSIDTNTLPAVDRQALHEQMQETTRKANEQRKLRQDEVAIEVKQRFDICKSVSKHEYLTNKKVKSYGLKQLNGNLVVPVYSTTGNLRSLQYIDKKGRKKFVTASEIKGNVFLIGTTFKDLPKCEKLVLAEGYSTSATIHEATNLPVACVFSANFLFDAATKLRSIATGTRFILALDHDESGVGDKKAQECATAISNCAVRLPSEVGDYNDLYLKHGLERVSNEIIDHKLGIKRYAIRNLVDKPEPVEWLVDSFIPLGKPGILAAVGGVGKSLSVIQLALTICNGGRWWGKDIKQKGNTVIFCAEDDMSEIHRRIDMLDPKGKRFDSEYEVYVFPVPEQKEPMILLREEGVTPIAQELVDELQAIPNLKLVCFDPLQAFTTGNVSSSNEVGQLWGSYCANISARLGVTTLTVHHLNKSALSNDSDDAMSHRAEIRGASSITDSVRWAIAMWLADTETCERICEEQGIEFDRMAVVKASLVKSNTGNVDYKIKTLFRKNAVLELLDDLQKPFNLYDKF